MDKENLALQIDALMQEVYKDNEPGAAIIVTKDGKTVFRKGYGMANFEHNITIEPQMVFRLGSISKQFTAVCILMLYEQGKLDLQDDITKYIPDYPTQAYKITIEHLLTHTSGIKSYTGMPEWLKMMRDDLTVEEMINLFKNQPMEFAPGTKWNYNNSGYFLLGAVIEKVSGMTYEEFLQKFIFEPLGMKDTYYDNPSRIIPGRVSGYKSAGEGFENSDFISLTQPYAAGSLASSVDDMAKWDAALYTEKLVKQETLQKAWKSYQLSSGKLTGYGYGWAVMEFNGIKLISHGGGIPGFITEGLRLPEEKIYVSILTNLGDKLVPELLAFKIASLVAGKPYEEPKGMELDPSLLESLPAVYEMKLEGFDTAIYKKEDKLVAQSPLFSETELIQLSDTEFVLKDTFHRITTEKEDGKVVRLIVTGMYGSGMVGERTDKPLPTDRKTIDLEKAVLETLVGVYEVGPGVEARVTFEEDSLQIQIPGQPKLKLHAESDVNFFIMEAPVSLEFRKDESGQVTGVIIDQGGQKMEAKKKK